MTALTAGGLALTALAQDPVPKDEDVVAGWLGAAVFLFLIVAVVLLLVSFVRQLRKAQAAKDAGVYGDPPVRPQPPGDRPEGQDGRG